MEHRIPESGGMPGPECESSGIPGKGEPRLSESGEMPGLEFLSPVENLEFWDHWIYMEILYLIGALNAIIFPENDTEWGFNQNDRLSNRAPAPKKDNHETHKLYSLCTKLSIFPNDST